LGSDLRCYLEDRPIHARRGTAVEQLWRWCRRNRAVASLAAVAVSLLALVAAVATIGYVRTSRANIQVKAALAKSERISGLSLEALDEIFERFVPDRSGTRSPLSATGASSEAASLPVQPVLKRAVGQGPPRGGTRGIQEVARDPAALPLEPSPPVQYRFELART